MHSTMKFTLRSTRALSKLTSASLFFAIFFLGTDSVLAKDLTHRFGLGIKNNTSEYLPSVAASYFPVSDLAFTAGLGTDTKKDNAKFQMHLGLRKIIFAETNLNFFSSIQVGLLNYEDPALGRQSGAELMGVVGVEFFFQGLENVGFTFEAGMAVASLRDVRFRTMADDPTRAGILFYF